MRRADGVTPALCRRHDRERRCRGRRRRRAFARCATSWFGADAGEFHRPHRLSHHVSGVAAQRRADRRLHQMVGRRTATSSSITSSRTATRSISSPAQPEPEFTRRILVGERRPRRTCARPLPASIAQVEQRARRLSRRAQMGDRRSRSAAPAGRDGNDDAARRCLPSDDALHGAGRGDGDRGCRRAVALPRRHRAATTSPTPSAASRRRARERTSRIQDTSRQNTWHAAEPTDPDWVYGYDAWTAPLAA